MKWVSVWLLTVAILTETLPASAQTAAPLYNVQLLKAPPRHFSDCMDAAAQAAANASLPPNQQVHDADTQLPTLRPASDNVNVSQLEDGTWWASEDYTYSPDWSSASVTVPDWSWDNMSDADNRALALVNDAIMTHENGHLTLANGVASQQSGALGATGDSAEGAIANLPIAEQSQDNITKAIYDETENQYDLRTHRGTTQSLGPPDFPGGPDTNLVCSPGSWSGTITIESHSPSPYPLSSCPSDMLGSTYTADPWVDTSSETHQIDIVQNKGTDHATVNHTYHTGCHEKGSTPCYSFTDNQLHPKPGLAGSFGGVPKQTGTASWDNWNIYDSVDTMAGTGDVLVSVVADPIDPYKLYVQLRRIAGQINGSTQFKFNTDGTGPTYSMFCKDVFDNGGVLARGAVAPVEADHRSGQKPLNPRDIYPWPFVLPGTALHGTAVREGDRLVLKGSVTSTADGWITTARWDLHGDK